MPIINWREFQFDIDHEMRSITIRHYEYFQTMGLNGWTDHTKMDGDFTLSYERPESGWAREFIDFNDIEIMISKQNFYHHAIMGNHVLIQLRRLKVLPIYWFDKKYEGCTRQEGFKIWLQEQKNKKYQILSDHIDNHAKHIKLFHKLLKTNEISADVSGELDE